MNPGRARGSQHPLLIQMTYFRTCLSSLNNKYTVVTIKDTLRR